MNDEIQGRQIVALGPSPVDLSKPSLESRSGDRASDLPAHGHSEARMLESVFNKKYCQVPSELPRAPPIAVLEIHAAAEPFIPRQRLPPARRWALARHRLDSQARSALAPAPRQDRPPLAGLHARSEAVLLFSTPVLWLICTFHGPVPSLWKAVPRATPTDLTTPSGPGRRRPNFGI